MGTLAALVLVLTGCGGGGATTTDPAADAAEEPADVDDGQQALDSATPEAEPTGGLEITVTERVPYTSELTTDVYAPTEPGPWPVVVMLHGTVAVRPVEQRREGLAPVAEAVSSQGAVVYNTSWRSSGESSPRESAEDAACAVRFARATAQEYGGDPGRLVLMGHSAGGAVAMVIALAGDDFEGDCVVSGVSALPHAYVGVAASYDPEKTPGDARLPLKEAHPKLYRALNPVMHLGENPELVVRIVHGQIDDINPAEAAMSFHQVLRDAGYEAEITVLDGIGHLSIIQTSFPEAFSTTVDETMAAATG